MDGFVDLDEAIKAEASSRLEKVEKLAGISANKGDIFKESND